MNITDTYKVLILSYVCCFDFSWFCLWYDFGFDYDPFQWFVVEGLGIRVLNTLGPRRNGRRFTDNILKCIFLNENVWISIEI